MSVLSNRPAVISEEGQNENATATSADPANSNTSTASGSEEERLSEYASGIRTFVPRQRLIIKYLGEGKSRQQIAELLNSKAGTVGTTILQMAAVLGIPHDGMGSKADYMASVLGRVHRYAIKNSQDEKPDI
jgi:DNA-binding NarL/FixJ family response regulator